MTWDSSQHPCFSDTARHRFARIHLPIAPDCNVQCNFCRRDYDCVNESRPGVTSTILTPHQALHYLGRVLELDPRITVVGIAGPGEGKYLFRFEVKEAHAHSAVAHDAFQVAHATAAAIALLGVQGYGDVAALPNAFHVGPAPVADAVADGPHPGEPVQLPARGGHPGGD